MATKAKPTTAAPSVDATEAKVTTEKVTFAKRHTHARVVYFPGDTATVTTAAARKLAKFGVITETDS